MFISVFLTTSLNVAKTYNIMFYQLRGLEIVIELIKYLNVIIALILITKTIYDSYIFPLIFFNSRNKITWRTFESST